MVRTFPALLVHPDAETARDLTRLLAGLPLGFEIASSHAHALVRMHEQPFALVIAVHSAGELDAASFLQASIAVAPEALRIALVSDPADAVELEFRPVQAGAIMRIVAAPTDQSTIVAMVAQGVRLLTMVDEQRELLRRLSSEQHRRQRRETLLDVVVKERTKELLDSYEKLKAANRQALFGLAEAIEAKDPYTKGHCGRVATYALVLAQELGYPSDGLETLEFGAFLHDIGKIGVRDAVLLKPAALDEAEWQHMREHPLKGFEIASKIEILQPIISAVRNHHEKWDGTGYPDRLKGEKIPVVARMVAIADAYDAMATDRPYKRALPADECTAVLRKQSGKMFDPELVDLFITRDIGSLFRSA